MFKSRYKSIILMIIVIACCIFHAHFENSQNLLNEFLRNESSNSCIRFTCYMSIGPVTSTYKIKKLYVNLLLMIIRKHNYPFEFTYHLPSYNAILGKNAIFSFALECPNLKTFVSYSFLLYFNTNLLHPHTGAYHFYSFKCYNIP